MPAKTFELSPNHFTSSEILNSNVSGETADPDGDEMDNRSEYLAGTDPRNSQSYLGIIAEPLGAGAFTIQVTVVAGRTYTVEFSESATGPWNFLTELRPTQTSAIKVEDAAIPQAARYYRILTPSKFH